ncbi:hypothetical protein JX266_014323 [Neoarthrinium moseri]|nr:hypothetical protein JX266_014323 [Neoarthrinium moseri]
MHTREQKVKARRSGKSLLGKARTLGKKANVFSMAMYWDPVHKKMRTVVHLPPGQKMPSLETFALKAISENSQQISPAIHTDRGGSTQPALVSPVEAGQAASSSIYDFPGEEEDTIIVRDSPRRVDQASPISPQRTVSEVTIDDDAKQAEDLWCYRDGRSAVVHQKGALRQGNLQIKQSCVVPRPGGVKKSSARERSWRMASLTGTNLSPGVPVKRRLPMQKQIMIRRVLHLLDSLGRKPRHEIAGTQDTNQSDLVYYSRPQAQAWG